MTWREHPIESWAKFDQFVLEPHVAVTPALRRSYTYRGQSNAAWTMLPSLTRLCKSLEFSATKAAEVEHNILDRFRSRVHLRSSHDVPADGDLLGWWTLMQHYRAPTRILDWTHSPLVALYFAVRTNWECDGAIWSFHRHSLAEALIKRDGQDNDLNFTNFPNVFFERIASPPCFNWFDRTRLNERMAAQQGTFTVSQDILCDHADPIEEVLPEYVDLADGKKSVLRSKWLIRKEAKKSILNRLHTMNVTAETLFPGIDGLGDEMAELVRLSG
jgi:hypothetical protein